LAITKQRKQELINEYVELLKQSNGLVITEYRGLSMKQLDALRGKLRENNANLTITKNTLFKIALKQVGMAAPEKLFTGPVAVAVAFGELSKAVKTVLEFTKESELFIAKGGVVGAAEFASKDLEAISTLPSLDELRAQLIGMTTMPLTQFLGLLEEPGRQVVAVIQAATDSSVSVFAAAISQDEAA